MNSSKRFDFLNNDTKNLFPIGLSTFDNVVGGGFPASSVNLIEEDIYQQYSTMLIKAFISNGISKEEKIIIFSEDLLDRTNRLFRELPTIQRTAALSSSSLPSNNPAFNKNESDMKIAFRYSNLPSRFSSDQFGDDISLEKFDFGDHLSSETVEKASIDFYRHSDICNILFKMTQDKPKGRFRIVVHSVGSCYSSINGADLIKTILKAKILMRKLKNATCLLTVLSGHESDDNDYELSTSFNRNQLYRICDSSLKIVSFSDDGDDKNPYSSDYVGILKFYKLQQLNSFTPYNRNLESNEYGLKLINSKRYLNIEKLSLPPDLGDNVSRFTSSTDSNQSNKLSCQSSVVNF